MATRWGREEGLLMIFIKNPVPGRVKTRLAATIGDEAAMEAYLNLLAHTRAVALGSPADREVWYSSFIDPEDDWESGDFASELQIEGDLGEKMAHAFRQAFSQHEVQKALIIGSDCGELQAHHLASAFEALDSHDAVIGPAHDGGYYLLGLTEMVESVFQDKVWSTETVFRDTLASLEAAGKKVALLPTLSDVDYEADWLRVKDYLLA